jgi:hypothetical protein
MKLNAAARNFRVVGPDETASNRLSALFEVTARAWMAERLPEDEQLAPDGRVMEILSEHTCQGWLEGYLLTGRHGFPQRRSSIDWTRCSVSTRSGSRSARRSMAPADAVEHPAHLPRLAADHNGFLTGSGSSIA